MNVIVRVAHCSALDDELRAMYFDLLDAGERQRNARFRFAADRDRHLLGRAMLRDSIASWVGVQAREVCLRVDPNGKPCLDGAGSSTRQSQRDKAVPGKALPLKTAPCFNLSHSGDWVVVALADAPVGIDVEHTARDNDVLSIADHYFFGDELRELHSFPEPEQRARFFDYWTLKEAYMKARGEGIALGLENFGFRLRGERDIELVVSENIDDNAQSWRFACLQPAPDYRLSLAVRSAEEPVLRFERYLPLRDAQQLDWSAATLHGGQNHAHV